MAKKVDKEIVDLPVDDLKPHPLNQELYKRRSAWEIEELAQAMKNGLEEPVEVPRDRTISSGPSRVAAAKLLGWKTISSWVRRDLAEAGPAAVEARLAEANLVRRQLPRLDMV